MKDKRKSKGLKNRFRLRKEQRKRKKELKKQIKQLTKMNEPDRLVYLQMTDPDNEAMKVIKYGDEQ